MYSKNEWTKWDYIQDAIGFRLDSISPPSIIVFTLWCTTIVGLFGGIIPEIKEYLYMFWVLGNPAYVVILLSLAPFDLFLNSKKIAKKLCNIYHMNPMNRILCYVLWSVMAVGFGIIFGTVGLFASPDNIYEYLLVAGVGLGFANITAIISRGYIRQSPIVEFFTKRITAKFPRLGYFM